MPIMFEQPCKNEGDKESEPWKKEEEIIENLPVDWSNTNLIDLEKDKAINQKQVRWKEKEDFKRSFNG